MRYLSRRPRLGDGDDALSLDHAAVDVDTSVRADDRAADSEYDKRKAAGYDNG